MTSKYLIEQGVSYELQRRYVKSGWFEKIAPGVLKRANEEVTWVGALHALQYVEKKKIRIVGRTALMLSGKSHFVYLGKYPIFLCLGKFENLPLWFSQAANKNVYVLNNSFLPENIGVEEKMVDGMKLKVSSYERAVLEMIYTASNTTLMEECLELVDSLINPQLPLLQKLLEHSSSVKVNRFLLYLADKTNQKWLADLNLSNIDLGSGKLSFDGGGVLIKKYNLVLPDRFANSYNFIESEC